MPSDEELRRARIATYLQQRALHGGAIWNVDQDLYQKIRAQVDEEDPTHSLDRNARMYELYQNALQGSGKEGKDAFGKELEKIGLTKEEYLREAKTAARSNKYNPDVLTFGAEQAEARQPRGPAVLRPGGLHGLHHVAAPGAGGKGAEGLRRPEAQGLPRVPRGHQPALRPREEHAQRAQHKYSLVTV